MTIAFTRDAHTERGSNGWIGMAGSPRCGGDSSPGSFLGCSGSSVDRAFAGLGCVQLLMLGQSS